MSRAVVVIMTLLALGALVSCGSGTKKSRTQPASTTAASTVTVAPTTATTPTTGAHAQTTTSGPTISWTRPSAQPDGSVPVAAFNALLAASHPTWALSPLRTAVEFVKLDDTAAFTTTVRVSTNPDSLHQAEVIVSADGLLDDSVHATRFDLHLARQSDQSWRLVSAEWSQQCQPNRGHQDFTPQLCV